MLGLISLIDCCRAAGTEGVAVDDFTVGDAAEVSAVGDSVVSVGSLSRNQISHSLLSSSRELIRT